VSIAPHGSALFSIPPSALPEEWQSPKTNRQGR
jgi:hypothetical protein